MDAIITAGGTFKPDDVLYQRFGIEKKALVPIAGRPMISWILSAAQDSGLVENTTIVGLEPAEIEFEGDHLYFTPTTGNLVDNVFAGLHKLQEVNPAVQKLLILSSDIPLVTPEIIQEFVEECSQQSGGAMYYAIVKKETMEAAFPNSNRTFVPFKGGHYSGGDAFLADVAAATGNKELAKLLTGSRKNYLQQARMIGFGFIIKFLFRTMTPQEAAKQASKKANFDGRVVVTRFAELGMDVDKPHQYEMVEAYLEERKSQAA